MHTTSPIARFSAFALVFALAGAAQAEKLKFSGTHAIKFSHNGVIKEVSASGTGVAIANGKAGPLHTLQLTRAFAKINKTTLATITGEGLEEIHFDAVRIDPSRAGPGGMPGVFKPILSAVQGMTLTKSTLPAAGQIRLCNLTGCTESLALNLAQSFMGAAVGPGVGGAIMASNPLTSMGMGGTVVTAVGQPWTVNAKTVSYETAMGAIISKFTDMGFAKGPLGMTGTTLNTIMTGTMGSMIMGGTLQLVSGTQTTCLGCGETSQPSGQITRLTINFQPEPNLLVMLSAGAVAVALLGRTRTRR